MVATVDVAYLVGQLPGLDPRVAAAWFKAESADEPTNPFGILYTTDYAGNGSHTAIAKSGRFAVYSSRAAGIRAAAYLVMHSGWATRIRSAIASGNAVAQRLAIIASPWAGGHYNQGTSFPSLSSMEAFAGVTGSTTGPAEPSGGSRSTSSRCDGVVPLPVDKGLIGQGNMFPIPRDRLDDPCACPPGYKRAQVDPQVEGLFGTNFVPLAQLTGDQANACILDKYGTGSVGIQDAAAALAAFGQGLVSLAVNGALLVLILVLAYSGLEDLLREPAQ